MGCLCCSSPEPPPKQKNKIKMKDNPSSNISSKKHKSTLKKQIRPFSKRSIIHYPSLQKSSKKSSTTTTQSTKSTYFTSYIYSSNKTSNSNNNTIYQQINSYENSNIIDNNSYDIKEDDTLYNSNIYNNYNYKIPSNNQIIIHNNTPPPPPNEPPPIDIVTKYSITPKLYNNNNNINDLNIINNIDNINNDIVPEININLPISQINVNNNIPYIIDDDGITIKSSILTLPKTYKRNSYGNVDIYYEGYNKNGITTMTTDDDGESDVESSENINDINMVNNNEICEYKFLDRIYSQHEYQ